MLRKLALTRCGRALSDATAYRENRHITSGRMLFPDSLLPRSYKFIPSNWLVLQCRYYHQRLSLGQRRLILEGGRHATTYTVP